MFREQLRKSKWKVEMCGGVNEAKYTDSGLFQFPYTTSQRADESEPRQGYNVCAISASTLSSVSADAHVSINLPSGQH